MSSKIRGIEVYYLQIPFKKTFSISKGTVGGPGKPGDHIYVKVFTGDGLEGWGEVRPSPSWMYENPYSVVSAIKYYLAEAIRGLEPYQIREALSRMDKVLALTLTAGMPFAKSGVEVALYDLVGRLYGAPLHALIGGKRRSYIEMSYLVSGTPEEIRKQCREALRKEYKLIKLKLMGDSEEDYMRLKIVLEETGDKGTKVWLDANQAYGRHSLAHFFRKISLHLDRVVVFEQPVSASDFETMKYARRLSPIPLAADESVYTVHDLAKLVRFDAVDAVVLKLAKSGIAENLKIASLAEAFGLDLYGSGMTESGVGLAASVHLFSVLNIVAPVDTNGPQFLEDLVVDGLLIEENRVKVPDKPGLGVKVNEEKLEEYRTDIKM